MMKSILRLVFLFPLFLLPAQGDEEVESFPEGAPVRSSREASWEKETGTIGRADLPASRQTHQGVAVHSLSMQPSERTDYYLEKFSSPEYREWLLGIRERSRDFLPYIKKESKELQLPFELTLLPAVESAFSSRAVSSSGAVGLWQFMMNSIGPYDITVDQWRDDRRDFMRATDGALRKLKYNYSVLGDWYLALAAYNCGLGRVQRTIDASGISDYWELAEKGLLPRETIQYVPRFLAAARILSYPGRYGLPLDWDLPAEWEALELEQAVDLRILAQKTNIPLEKLETGNSELRYGITPPGSSDYRLKVPAEYSDSIKEVLAAEEDKLIRFYIHKIGSGDTFYALARHFGVTVDMISAYNPGANPAVLRIGQKIVIPAYREVGPYRSETVAEADYTAVYTVASGDSLWSISRTFGITPEELARNNGLNLNGILKAGTRLQVPELENRNGI